MGPVLRETYQWNFVSRICAMYRDTLCLLLKHQSTKKQTYSNDSGGMNLICMHKDGVGDSLCICVSCCMLLDYCMIDNAWSCQTFLHIRQDGLLLLLTVSALSIYNYWSIWILNGSLMIQDLVWLSRNLLCYTLTQILFNGLLRYQWSLATDILYISFCDFELVSRLLKL